MREGPGGERGPSTPVQSSINNGRSYVFVGGCGTGKTHLAIGIIRAVIDAGFSAKYANLPDAMAKINATYCKTNGMAMESENQIIESFVSPDLLVLDEVSVQYGTTTESLILFRILNRRYEDVKPTILISNVELSKLTELVGELIIDRLCEGGGGILEFIWESARGVDLASDAVRAYDGGQSRDQTARDAAQNERSSV